MNFKTGIFGLLLCLLGNVCPLHTGGSSDTTRPSGDIAPPGEEVSYWKNQAHWGAAFTAFGPADQPLPANINKYFSKLKKYKVMTVSGDGSCWVRSLLISSFGQMFAEGKGASFDSFVAQLAATKNVFKDDPAFFKDNPIDDAIAIVKIIGEHKQFKEWIDMLNHKNVDSVLVKAITHIVSSQLRQDKDPFADQVAVSCPVDNGKTTETFVKYFSSMEPTKLAGRGTLSTKTASGLITIAYVGDQDDAPADHLAIAVNPPDFFDAGDRLFIRKDWSLSPKTWVIELARVNKSGDENHLDVIIHPEIWSKKL